MKICVFVLLFLKTAGTVDLPAIGEHFPWMTKVNNIVIETDLVYQNKEIN